jgi:hypothetical protein
MNTPFRKARRLWITYVTWGKWSGMWGRYTLGHAFQGQQLVEGPLVTDEATGNVAPSMSTSYVWMQQVDYASAAPRVFADREALLSFMKILDDFGGRKGVITVPYQPPLPAEQAVASILETPTAQLTEIHLTVGLSPETTLTMHSSPGWDLNSKPDPRDGMNEMNVHNYQGVHCVKIMGMKFHAGDRMQQEIAVVVDALRRYTTDPSKDQLRKLKGGFPLVNEDTRQTVREQKFQSGVQKRAAWIGGGAAVAVSILAEVVKASLGAQ